MRTRLNLLTAGITILVVVAFVVPLGFLVDRQADQRGRLDAERTAQTLAAVVVRAAVTSEGLGAPGLTVLLGPVPEGSAVVLEDGTTIGPAEPDGALLAEVAAAGTSLAAYNDAGYGIAIPVFTEAGTIVVYSSVPDEDLERGVLRAWLLLLLLGAGLVAASLVISDRLGRAVVGPSRRIARAAEALGGGDLDVRVEEEGPEELVAIAEAFNTLAGRIRALLYAEREEVADLSHRLRTPLAALRLRVEQLRDPEERAELGSQLDRMSKAVDELIVEARVPSEGTETVIDVLAVLEARIKFWGLLAEDQGREFHVDIPTGPASVKTTREDSAAAFDSLIGNVFTHTSAGVGFGIVARVGNELVEIEIADDGDGFPEGLDPVERGASAAGSSGLGLDIARSMAAKAGGELIVGSSHTGGARVLLRLPVVAG
jgi:signal transduction histidine kinase